MILPLFDWLVFGLYVMILLGYSWLIERSPWSKHTLSVQMGKVRRQWFEECLRRQIRMPDTLIMGMLQNGTAYFGSAALLGIGAGFTLLSASDSLPPILGDGQGLALKALFMMLIFAASFFQFAWAYRLFNYNAIAIGAIPQDDLDSPQAQQAVNCAKALNVVAGQHFNQAIRLFLFAIPIIFWLISPWALLVTTLGLTFIMLRRQFLTNRHLQGLALAWELKKNGDQDGI